MVRPTRLRRTTLQKVTEAVPYGVGRQIGGMIAATGERSRFRAMVAEADRARDRGDWAEAERGYRAALAIVPDSAGYRVQLGHMLKEQGRNAEAEVQYRHACALGVEPAKVDQHLRHVVAQQGAAPDQWPPRYGSDAPMPARVPTPDDVNAFARLLWLVPAAGVEDTVALLRLSATCDALFAAMVADARFDQANMTFLEVLRLGEI